MFSIIGSLYRSISGTVSNNYDHYRKYARYKGGVYRNVLNETCNPFWENYWNEIDDGIILGAMPLANFDHHKTISSLGVKNILTILEDFEIQTDTFVSHPVQASDWKSLNVDQLIIESPDHDGVETDKISEGVHFIKKCVKAGEKVYVHCKSGHGRSAAVVIAYLMETRGMDVRQAFGYTKSKRSVVNLNSEQFASLDKYYNLYCRKRLL